MRYLYTSEQNNYEDFSSGRVLYNMPGTAPFPVRLGCEIFERCRAALIKKGVNGPYTVYDPFCGGAYLLTTLGFIFGEHIERIVASDFDDRMVSMASRNLGLLSVHGLQQRIKQIEQLMKDYDKESHKNTFDSALRLRSLLETRGKELKVDCFCANALELKEHMQKIGKVDIVITDLPYGRITNWSEQDEENSQAEMFLESLHSVIPSHSVVAVVSDKKQKVRHSQFKRVEHFNAGKRKITLLEKHRGTVLLC